MEPTAFKLSNGTSVSRPNSFGAADFYTSADVDELQELAAMNCGAASEMAQLELDARWALGR